jgi:hypothetical protein
MTPGLNRVVKEAPGADRPQQFKAVEDWLHVERERVRSLTLNWRPVPMRDIRDKRPPQLLGETLLRMQKSLGLPCSETADIIEGLT